MAQVITQTHVSDIVDYKAKYNLPATCTRIFVTEGTDKVVIAWAFGVGAPGTDYALLPNGSYYHDQTKGAGKVYQKDGTPGLADGTLNALN